MTANPGDNAERVTSPNEMRGSIPADTFAARLVLVRHFAGRLSIEQAAKRCGLNAGNWAHWEDGRRPRDQIEVARAVAESLGVDFTWVLLGGPLAGPRGMPTRRTPEDNGGYLSVHVRPRDVRPRDTRPIGRAAAGAAHTTGPTPRRPVRISRPSAA